MTHDWRFSGYVPIFETPLFRCSRCNRTLYSEQYRNAECHGKPDVTTFEKLSAAAKVKRRKTAERKTQWKTQST